MAFDHLRILTDQPLAADREPAIAFGFRYFGFLQQGQRAAARAEEYESRIYAAYRVAMMVLHPHPPATIRLLFQPHDAVAQFELEVSLFV